MRKSIYILAAVATMLVSCGQTEKINNDLKDTTEPRVIGFSSYSEKATRGDASVSTNLEYYHNTFVVYGTKQNINDASNMQYVFGGTATAAGVQDGVTCSYQDPSMPSALGDWRYDDPRYWDKQAKYDFIAYAPEAAANPIRYNYNAQYAKVGAAGNEFLTTDTFTLAGTNIQSTPTESEKVKGFTVEAGGDLDLMVSGHTGPLDGAVYRDDVNLSFRHILSKLNVKITKGEGLNDVIVNVKEVTITGLDDSGNYTSSTYSAGTATGWTSLSVDSTYTLTYSDSTGQILNKGSYSTTTPAVFTPGKPYYFIESLIIPQGIADEQVKVKVTYTIKNNEQAAEQNFSNEVDLYDLDDLRVLKEGYNYTLTCTVQTEMITFDAATTPWADINASKDIVAQGQ